MKTQREQIKAAKRAYIFTLNPASKGATGRYTIYLDNGRGLEILWPNYDERDQFNGLNYQVATENRKLPKYHFRVSGYGFSKCGELRDVLRNINPNIIVATLDGYSPCMSV